jgi:hypothetical protein
VTKELKDKLNQAIHEAITRQRGAFSGGDIAASVKRADTDLWDEAREVMATEKLIAIADGMMRGPLHQANSAQMALEGFEDIPKYIRAGRKWIEIEDANADQLTEFIDWYAVKSEKSGARAKRDRRILTDMRRLAGVVRRYNKKTPGITLGSVLEIKEAKAELVAMRHESE